MNCQAKEFFLPQDVTYLNCAYKSPMLKSVREAAESGLEKKMYPYTIDRKDFFEPVDHVRSQFARLIGTRDKDRMAIVPSVSYGLANAASNIPLGSGDEILLIGEQFPSNVYPWRVQAAKFGAKIVTVEAPSGAENRGEQWNQKILEAISERTKVVAMPIVHWADGTLFDIEEIGRRCRQFESYLVIDGTQSIGALPFDMNKVQPDVLVCAGYKWLLGAYGLGLSYYGPRFDEGMPFEQNWINREDSQNFENLVNYTDAYGPQARRYDMGENSNFTLMPMLSAALKAIIEWTPHAIQEYCEEISAAAIEQLRELGCQIEQQEFRANHLFGIRVPKHVDLNTLKQEFANQRIYVSVRGDAIRVSPHVYNASAHVEKLVSCVRSCMK